jgi:SAGA-associated factor 73
MAASARKAPPRGQSNTRSSHPQNSVIERKVYEKLLAAEAKKPIKVSIRRKALTLPSEPGSWQGKSEKPRPALPNAFSKASDGANPPSLVNAVDSRISRSLPSGKPFEDPAVMILCKHCKKPVYKPAALGHIKDCLRKKQEKLQRKKEAREAKGAALRKERNGGISPEPAGDARRSIGNTRKAAADADGEKKSGKKRKAGDDGQAPVPKRKRKDNGKPKTGKVKGPVDVEKQCGVPLPNGAMCARSLTCKSHSMGAKRAVAGRSMRYDLLLAQYQKRNHARQHSEWHSFPYAPQTNSMFRSCNGRKCTARRRLRTAREDRFRRGAGHCYGRHRSILSMRSFYRRSHHGDSACYLESSSPSTAAHVHQIQRSTQVGFG